MEKKLAKYRAEQEKLEKVKHYQNKVKNLFSSVIPKTDSGQSKETDEKQNGYAKDSCSSSYLKQRRMMKISEDKKNLLPADDVISIDEESLLDDSFTCCSWLQLLYYFLCFIFWGTLYMVFIKLEFGTVYFVSSALILMYLNTRTDTKKTGELSAYSVFNKDCVSIDGTLKAEQFEREIMYGPGSVM